MARANPHKKKKKVINTNGKSNPFPTKAFFMYVCLIFIVVVAVRKHCFTYPDMQS